MLGGGGGGGRGPIPAGRRRCPPPASPWARAAVGDPPPPPRGSPFSPGGPQPDPAGRAEAPLCCPEGPGPALARVGVGGVVGSPSPPRPGLGGGLRRGWGGPVSLAEERDGASQVGGKENADNTF